MAAEPTAIVMREIDDPAELASAAKQDERFQRNWRWFEPRAAAVYEQHRGQCICVAGQEIFAGNTPAEALSRAAAAHPDDDGRFTIYIPREKRERIYAH